MFNVVSAGGDISSRWVQRRDSLAREGLGTFVSHGAADI
jgi:hypothetical protein